jgi:hypothetical protein
MFAEPVGVWKLFSVENDFLLSVGKRLIAGTDV